MEPYQLEKRIRIRNVKLGSRVIPDEPVLANYTGGYRVSGSLCAIAKIFKFRTGNRYNLLAYLAYASESDRPQGSTAGRSVLAPMIEQDRQHWSPSQIAEQLSPKKPGNGIPTTEGLRVCMWSVHTLARMASEFRKRASGAGRSRLLTGYPTGAKVSHQNMVSFYSTLESSPPVGGYWRSGGGDGGAAFSASQKQ